MENEIFKEELDKMELRLSDMEDKLDKLDEKLTQVVDAILGNPLTKQGGFIHDIDVLKAKIESLERKQRSLEEFKKKMYWTAGIVVAVVIGFMYLTSIYANLKR